MITRLNKYRRQLLKTAWPAGATVMMIDPNRQNKLEPKYIGPYTVIRRNRAGNYYLKDATGEPLDRQVPPDQLKLIAKKPRAVDLSGCNISLSFILCLPVILPLSFLFVTFWLRDLAFRRLASYRCSCFAGS